MSRIAGFRERIKLILKNQREFTQQAELVWGCDNDPAAGFTQAAQFPCKGPWVFEVFDRFDSRHDISRPVWKRNTILVDVEFIKLPCGRESIVADHINSDVSFKLIPNKAPQPPCSTSNIE
jgi:hypothetical protein